MKRVLPKVLILAMLCAGGYALYLYWWKPSAGAADELVLYGNVEIHQVDLGFRVGGRISEMLVDEGASVRAGDVLARLDPIPLEDELRIAAANVAMQEANVSKAESGYRTEEIAVARAALQERAATVRNLKLSLDRLQSLRRDGGISQQNLEDSQARYQEAVARHEAARTQLAMLEAGFRAEDIAVQKAALEVARATEAKVRTALNDTMLYAPEDGIVLTRAREKGAIVSAGQSVYSLSLTDPVHIRAYAPQPRLGLIRPGASVLLEIAAMPGKQYPGHIGHISSTAEFTPKSVETEEVRNDLVFRIRILAQDPDNVFRQGMPVTIRLVE